MKEIGTLLLVMVFSALLAGIYGVLHDRITYSISHEYFTKFKCAQFGFEPVWFGGNMPAVAVIGFPATWWVGGFISTGLGVLGLLFRDAATMRKAIRRAIALVYCTAIVAGIAGFIYGKYYLVNKEVDWWLPVGLINKNDFITVGSIHNFSYAGGIVGLVVGALYMLKTRYLPIAMRGRA